jgi:hypothetical protein
VYKASQHGYRNAYIKTPFKCVKTSECIFCNFFSSNSENTFQVSFPRQKNSKNRAKIKIQGRKETREEKNSNTFIATNQCIE